MNTAIDFFNSLSLEHLTILWVIVSLTLTIPIIWISDIIAMLLHERKIKKNRRKNPIKSDWKF